MPNFIFWLGRWQGNLDTFTLRNGRMLKFGKLQTAIDPPPPSFYVALFFGNPKIRQQIYLDRDRPPFPPFPEICYKIAALWIFLKIHPNFGILSSLTKRSQFCCCYFPNVYTKSVIHVAMSLSFHQLVGSVSVSVPPVYKSLDEAILLIMLCPP